MSAKFHQSWQLFKASITVTFRNLKLLWFPVLSAFLTGLIALFFLAPVILPVVQHQTGYHLNQSQHWMALCNYYLPEAAINARLQHRAAAPNAAVAHISPLISAYVPVLYFVSMFLATFFNVAFYSEIIEALNGRGVSFRRGLRLARSRLPSILAWTLLAGVVGWIIRTIEERLPFVARIVAGLIGMAWSIAAVFAIPIIIQQGTMRNPIKILQQSALTLKRTWGEGLIGYIGFSAGNLVIFGLSLVPFLLLVGLGLLLHSIWIFVVAVMFWLIGL